MPKNQVQTCGYCNIGDGAPHGHKTAATALSITPSQDGALSKGKWGANKTDFSSSLSEAFRDTPHPMLRYSPGSHGHPRPITGKRVGGGVTGLDPPLFIHWGRWGPRAKQGAQVSPESRGPQWGFGEAWMAGSGAVGAWKRRRVLAEETGGVLICTRAQQACEAGAQGGGLARGAEAQSLQGLGSPGTELGLFPSSCRCGAETPGSGGRSTRWKVSGLQGGGRGARRGRLLDLL